MRRDDPAKVLEHPRSLALLRSDFDLSVLLFLGEEVAGDGLAFDLR